MNKLTATILSTISLSGAALIAAAVLSTTSSHAAPAAEAPKGDVVIDVAALTVTEELPGTAVEVRALPARRAAKKAPFVMTHVARVASSETVDNYRRTRSLSNITFDLAPQL